MAITGQKAWFRESTKTRADHMDNLMDGIQNGLISLSIDISASGRESNLRGQYLLKAEII